MTKKSLLTGGVVALTAAAIFSGCQQASQPQLPPAQVLQNGMKNLTAVTSHQFEFDVNANINAPAGQTPAKTTFTGSLSGSADMKDMTDPKVNLMLNASGSADTQSGDGALELRLNKDALYFTLSKLDSQGGQPLPAEITAYIGKWWKIAIPAGTLEQLTQSSSQEGTQQVSPQQQQLRDLLANTQFFTNVQFVAIEDVKGTSSYHYTADVDKTALMNFATQAAVIQGKPMSDDDKKSFQDMLSKLTMKGNVWVASDSNIMDKVTLDVQVAATAPTDSTGTVSLGLTLWGFNQPVTVEIPANTTDFPVDQVLGGLMGAGLSNAPTTDTTGATPNLDMTGIGSGSGSDGSTLTPDQINAMMTQQSGQ